MVARKDDMLGFLPGAMEGLAGKRGDVFKSTRKFVGPNSIEVNGQVFEGDNIVIATVSGLIFGLGLAVPEMVNPQKVLGFLDVAGNWNLSLALVMGGALIVTGGTFGLILKRSQPLFDGQFHVPTRNDIDAKLLLGAGNFGLGWGIVGLCLGPAIVGLAYGHMDSVRFVLAMFGKFALHRLYNHFF